MNTLKLFFSRPFCTTIFTDPVAAFFSVALNSSYQVYEDRLGVAGISDSSFITTANLDRLPGEDSDSYLPLYSDMYEKLRDEDRF